MVLPGLGTSKTSESKVSAMRMVGELGGEGTGQAGVQDLPLGQGTEGTLTPRSGGGRLSKCNELTVS